MAYDVEQLINLQNQIGNEPVMPDALDRYAAMQNITQQGGLPSIMLAGGGQPSIDAQVQNLASKGRYGDTMLMHVNPKEVAGLGGLTINPETGLPEAFWALLPFMAKAMIIGAGIGAGRKALGGSGSWLQNILGGAAVGSLGGTLLGPAGASVIGGPGQFLGAAASQAPTAVLGTSAIPAGFLGATQAAGAGTTAVPAGFLGATQAAGGAGGVGLSNAPLASTASPSWMEKIFTSAPWKSIEEHPYRTAATLGGVAAMLPSEQTYGDEYDLTSAVPSVSGFGPFIPKEPRELIEPLTQAQIEEGGPYNFYSKEGGLLSVINRQGGGSPGVGSTAGGFTSNPYGTPTYAMGLTNRPDAMERPRGSMGDPRYAKPMGLAEWNINFGPGSEYAGEGGGDGGGAVPVVENPFQFPTVTPFQSAISDFDLESSLARIGGEPYAIPSVPVVESFPIEESVVSFPALDDLYARTAAKIDDPIVSVVAEELNKNSGGLVELAVGGVPNVFEGRVQGVGDGMADQVPFNVIPQTREDIPKTPDMALLSSDEYVVPADVVSMLGNGSSTAGAQALDKFNKLMRRKAHGTNKQQREISAGKELSSLG
jgi:hypothetical protein